MSGKPCLTSLPTFKVLMCATGHKKVCAHGMGLIQDFPLGCSVCLRGVCFNRKVHLPFSILTKLKKNDRFLQENQHFDLKRRVIIEHLNLPLLITVSIVCVCLSMFVLYFVLYREFEVSSDYYTASPHSSEPRTSVTTNSTIYEDFVELY